MSEVQQYLNYVYFKDDNINPDSITLRLNGKFNRKENIVINIPGRFQRISVYENELTVCEEMTPGQHAFRFNKPYTEIEPGVLYFE